MRLFKPVILIATFILYMAYAEIIFVDTFQKIITGDTTGISLIKLLVSISAPMSIVFYYFAAYHLSISICNGILSKLDNINQNKTHAPLKILIEDYNLSHEGFIMPILLFISRATVIIALSYKAIFSYLPELTSRQILIIICLVLIITTIFVMIRSVGKKFSNLQQERMFIIKSFVDTNVNKLDHEQLLQISKLNRKLFSRKLIVSFFSFAAKPIIDFFIIFSVFLVIYFGYTENFKNEFGYVGLGLVAYRMIGPSLNLLTNINQILFSWNGLSKTWQIQFIKLAKIW